MSKLNFVLLAKALLGLAFVSQLSCVTVSKPDKPEIPVVLIESPILETSFDQESVENTTEAWIKLIRQAQISIDFSQQYINIIDAPPAMEQILSELRRAGERGVKIRFLVGNHLQKRGGQDVIDSVASLKSFPNLELRETSRWEADKGVLHTKYMIIDKKIAFIGSANFDWKALEHIKETGFIIDSEPAAKRLTALFEDDWQKYDSPQSSQSLPEDFSDKISWQEDDKEAWFQLKLSPPLHQLAEKHWDLPQLIELINSAEKTIKLTAMNFSTRMFVANSYFYDIQNALTAAAKRGVKVQVMFDDRSHPFPLRILDEHGVEVKKVKIPLHSSGEIPFARLIHAKYVVVDGHRIWTGSANFGGDYFYFSRNLSVFLESKKIGEQLEKMFDTYWTSEYAQLFKAKERPKKMPQSMPVGH